MFGRVLRQASVRSVALPRTDFRWRLAARSFSNKAIESWNNFNSAGIHYLQAGDMSKAEHMFRACLAMEKDKDEALLPSKRPYLSLSFANLGMVFRRQQKYADATQILSQAVTNLSRLSTQVDAGVLANIHRELGSCYAETEEHDSAVEQFQEAMELYDAPSVLVDRDENTKLQQAKDRTECAYSLATSMHHWANQNKAGSPSMEKVVAAYMEALESGAKAFGVDHLNMAEILRGMGAAQLACDWRGDAKISFMSSAEIYSKHKSPKLAEVLEDYMVIVGDEAVKDPLAAAFMESVKAEQEEKKGPNKPAL